MKKLKKLSILFLLFFSLFSLKCFSLPGGDSIDKISEEEQVPTYYSNQDSSEKLENTQPLKSDLYFIRDFKGNRWVVDTEELYNIVYDAAK